ncbi:MAG: CDP-archaeol synthase [Thiotrichales bacterium]
MINSTHANLMLLLLIANGAPVLARYVFGERFSKPIDLNRRFFDNRPILGHSKTYRGVTAAILATGLAAPVLGISPFWGVLIGSLTMLGDLITSFIKRRLSIEPSGMALGFDHIPEAMLPLLVISNHFGLSALEIITMAVAFWVIAIGLSRILFVWNIRRRPY